MDFEEKLIQLCHTTVETPDPEKFIDQLRGKQVAIRRRKQQLFMGTTMLAFILLVGMVTVNQLQSPMTLTTPANSQSSFLLTAEEEKQLWEEMALYVLESEDDLWTALEFLDEVEFEDLNNNITEAN